METTNKEFTILNHLHENKNHAPAMDVGELAADLQMSKKTVKGLIGSLTKKGLVSNMEVNRTIQTTYITNAGSKHVEQVAMEAADNKFDAGEFH